MRWRNPRYDPRYGYPTWGRPRYRSNGSCLRDACLLETGCCLGEALEDNCLMSAVLLLPRLALTTASAALGPPVPDAVTPAARRRPAGAMVAAIRLYQARISARRAPCCRFTPSCSAYAVEAIERHGAWRGAALVGRRLLRCRPGGRRGADPCRWGWTRRPAAGGGTAVGTVPGRPAVAGRSETTRRAARPDRQAVGRGRFAGGE